MAIIQTVTESMFIDEFDAMNRADNFTRPARRELFDYYDELSEDTGEAFELDVIAVCCDWTEGTAEQLATEYSSAVPWPDVYRYVVDLDERGEYRATVYKVAADGTEAAMATVDGAMFGEGAELEGLTPADREEIIDEVLNCSVDHLLSADDDLDTVYEEWVDALKDHTTVIEVRQPFSGGTYLVEAF